MAERSSHRSRLSAVATHRIEAAIVVVLAAGCGADDVAAPVLTAPVLTAPSSTVSATTAPVRTAPSLAADVEYPRHLHDRGQVQVGIRNTGDAEVVVDGISLSSPMFEPAGPAPRGTSIPVGRRRTLAVPIGIAVCPTGNQTPPASTATVELGYGGDGERAPEVVELAADAAALVRIHDAECGRRAAAARVQLTFGDQLDLGADVVRTTIDATTIDATAIDTATNDTATNDTATNDTATNDPARNDAGRRTDASGGTVRLDGVRGTVLFDLRPAQTAEPLAVLDSSTMTASVPVELRATRCDPHAVAESKRSFAFSAWITLEGFDQVHVVVEPGDELRAALQTLVDRCLATEYG